MTPGVIDRQLAWAGAGAEAHFGPGGPFVHDPLGQATDAASALAAVTGRPVADFRADGTDVPDFREQSVEWGVGP